MITATQMDRLERLADLKRSGVLSDQEFEDQKAQVLADKPGAIRTAFDHLATFTSPPTSKADGPLSWAILPLKRYAEFEGRSSRREFWLFFGGLCAAYSIAFLWLLIIIGTSGSFGVFGGLVLLIISVATIGIIIPSLALQVRRFHDQNKSGWFALLNLVPYLGGFIVLIFMCLPGTSGDNGFGPDPLK